MEILGVKLSLIMRKARYIYGLGEALKGCSYINCLKNKSTEQGFFGVMQMRECVQVQSGFIIWLKFIHLVYSIN